MHNCALSTVINSCNYALPHCQTNILGKATGYALARTIEKRTCFLKKVVSFKYGKTVSVRAIKLQYQEKTAGNFRKTEERNEKNREEELKNFCKTKGRGT